MSAFDTYLTLRIGNKFRLRGREYALADYGGTGGRDERGEYFTCYAFPLSGRGGAEQLVKFRPGEKLERLP